MLDCRVLATTPTTRRSIPEIEDDHVPDRVLAGKEHARSPFAEDDDRFGSGAVVFAEQPAAAEGNRQRLVIGGASPPSR